VSAKTNCYCTRQFSNLFGLMPFNCTVSNSSIEIFRRFQKKFLRIVIDALYITNDTLHHVLPVPYIREEIKRLDMLRYADRMVGHSNNLRKKLIRSVKTLCRLTSRLLQDLIAKSIRQFYKVHTTGHIVFKSL